MKRVEVFTREQLLLETLTQLIQEAIDEGVESYSILIAEVYAELVREILVQKAEAAMGVAEPESLLWLATSSVESRLRQRLGDTRFNLFHYKENIYGTLKAPVSISEVGLKNSDIQSLIAIPSGYKCYLDFT
jgi:hypothetical protein